MSHSQIPNTARGSRNWVADFAAVAPIFVIYHLGLPFVSVQNGADFVSTFFFWIYQRSVLAYIAVVLAIPLVAIGIARRGGTKSKTDSWWRSIGKTWLRGALEGAVLSFVLAWISSYVTQLILHSMTPSLATDALAKLGFVDAIVLSCGAGFHEELVFRAGLFSLLWLWLKRRWSSSKPSRFFAFCVAALVSSLLFSLAHHIGFGSEAFSLGPFVFRTVSGLCFASIFFARGFAVAVYTHALYDIWVLAF